MKYGSLGPTSGPITIETCTGSCKYLRSNQLNSIVILHTELNKSYSHQKGSPVINNTYHHITSSRIPLNDPLELQLGLLINPGLLIVYVVNQ